MRFRCFQFTLKLINFLSSILIVSRHSVVLTFSRGEITLYCILYCTVLLCSTILHCTVLYCILILLTVLYYYVVFLPSPVQCTGLGQYVACQSVSLSVCLSVCLSVTIILLILLLTLNYHSPPLYAGQFILLKPLKSKHWRRDQLGPV